VTEGMQVEGDRVDMTGMMSPSRKAHVFHEDPERGEFTSWERNPPKCGGDGESSESDVLLPAENPERRLSHPEDPHTGDERPDHATRAHGHEQGRNRSEDARGCNLVDAVRLRV
jgi:hypothetical protein